jgi:glycosyltransferase involved in cell wall biosynthesis
MAPKPLVSVLIPVYNGAQHLAQSLECVRTQTYRTLEILIKDDGSTDGSREIAAEFAARDSRIKLIDAPPSGGAIANHIALAKLAKGRYVKYLHQDDLIDADNIATLLRPMLADPRITLATSSRRRIDGEGTVSVSPGNHYDPLITRNDVLDGRDIIRHMLANQLNQIGEPSVTLFRNRLVNPEAMFDFGGRTHVMLFDLALWANLLLRGNLYFHAAPLSSYRVHDTQLSQQSTTIYDCNLEWTAMIRGAVDLGVLKPGGQLSLAGERRIANIKIYRDQIVGTGDSDLAERYLDPYDAAVAELCQLTGVSA